MYDDDSHMTAEVIELLKQILAIEFTAQNIDFTPVRTLRAY